MIRIFLILFSATLIVLQANLSYETEFSQLLNDYQNYSGSEYLKKNLSPEKETTLFSGPTEMLHSNSRQEFEQIQKELSFRKEKEMKAFEEVILKNGLFQPPKELWDKLRNYSGPTDYENLIEEQYNLQTILTVALQKNRSIKKGYEKAKASLEKYNQVSNLDEILNQYSVFTKGLNIKTGKPKHMKSPSMNFPFPGMLSLKGNIVDKEIALAKLELENIVQNVITKIRKTYYETVYLNEAIGITEETIGLLKRLRGVINRIYTTGKTTLNDVVKIQIEIDRRENDLLDLDEKKKTLQVTINTLLDISSVFQPQKIENSGPNILSYKIEGLIKEGLVNRNLLKKTVTKLERMQLIIEMAEKKFYPDFTSGYSFFQNSLLKQVGTDAPSQTFSARPKIKGGNWFGSNDAYIRETKIKYKALREKLEELKNNTIDEITRAINRYETADRDRQLYEIHLVPKAALTIEITEALYRTGKVDFLELIDSEARYLNYNLTLKRSIKTMNIEAANIKRLVGKGL